MLIEVPASYVMKRAKKEEAPVLVQADGKERLYAVLRKELFHRAGGVAPFLHQLKLRRLLRRLHIITGIRDQEGFRRRHQEPRVAVAGKPGQIQNILPG